MVIYYFVNVFEYIFRSDYVHAKYNSLIEMKQMATGQSITVMLSRIWPLKIFLYVVIYITKGRMKNDWMSL